MERFSDYIQGVCLGLLEHTKGILTEEVTARRDVASSIYISKSNRLREKFISVIKYRMSFYNSMDGKKFVIDCLANGNYPV